MMDFIEQLRAKPAHVRKRIALGASACATLLVTLVWFTAISASGMLAAAPAKQNADMPSAFSKESGASLLGAIGALGKSAAGSIAVVGTRASSTMQQEAPDERTVIPF